MNASRFTFDPDYHVDMILFRRILGTVWYNATYLKPAVTCWLIDASAGRRSSSTRWPTVRRCSPGHSINMGARIMRDSCTRTSKGGFNVVLNYGVLFDLRGVVAERRQQDRAAGVDASSSRSTAPQPRPSRPRSSSSSKRPLFAPRTSTAADSPAVVSRLLFGRLIPR